MRRRKKNLLFQLIEKKLEQMEDSIKIKAKMMKIWNRVMVRTMKNMKIERTVQKKATQILS